MRHHPVGRKSSGFALPGTTGRTVPLSNHQPSREYSPMSRNRLTQDRPEEHKRDPEKEAAEIREIGTPMEDSSSALKPPALTDSEYDSESDDEHDMNSGPLTTSIFRKRPWLANSSGIAVENKTKIGSTVPNKMDTFQPLGRASSRARISQSNKRETATI